MVYDALAMRRLRALAARLDRIVRLDTKGPGDAVLLIALILAASSLPILLERAGSEYLDLDVDLGMVVTFLGLFFYLVYRFWDGLRGAHAAWYEGLAATAMAVPVVIASLRILSAGPTFTGSLILFLLGLAVMGVAWLLTRLRIDPQDSFVRSWVVACSFVVAAGIAWAVSSVLTIVLWRVVERPVLQKRISGDRPVIAITLSGGGYRAAMTHAGVLWALDQAGLSPSILSTVSGGSIIGAAYSIGWEPLQFRDQLMRKKPYLSSDLVNLVFVAAQVSQPYTTTGDTFALHLARRFFGAATLDQTMPNVLLINATNYADGKRHVFDSAIRGRTWRLPKFFGGRAVELGNILPGMSNDRHLARLVAASGAFPGAFAPVRVGDDYYLDGGVRENLGVEGLHQFLDARPAERARVRAVIVSDLGLDSNEPSAATQPSAVQGALRAFELLYAAAEPAVRRRFLRPAGQPVDDLHWSLVGFSEPSTAIPVLYLKPRSVYGNSQFSDPNDLALVRTVTSLPALHELSSRQAAIAFWAGAQLATGVIPELCALVGRPSCPQPRADSLRP